MQQPHVRQPSPPRASHRLNQPTTQTRQKGRMMTTFTQQEFDEMPLSLDGIKQCPNGDYSTISIFKIMCNFKQGCSFAECSTFTRPCHFGACTSFGEQCSFNLPCLFGNQCSFAEGCCFYEPCGFGVFCSFAKRCNFSYECSFSENCAFSCNLNFGKFCEFEGNHKAKTTTPYLAVDCIGSENRKTYFFNFETGIHIRAGCFFGTEKQFIVKLKCDGDAQKTKIYTMALDLAKLQFAYGAK